MSGYIILLISHSPSFNIKQSSRAVFYVQKVTCHFCVLTCCPAAVHCKQTTPPTNTHTQQKILLSYGIWHALCRAHYYASLFHNLGSVTQCDNVMLKWVANMHCPRWSALATSNYYVTILLYLVQTGLFWAIKLPNKNTCCKLYFTLTN